MDLLARDVTFATLAKSLEGLAKRQSLIAQNISNVNTPGYKRRDVTFTDELASALKTEGKRDDVVGKILDSVAKEVVEDGLFFRPDMGGVDLDREMSEQAKVSMMQAAVVQLTQKKLRSYRTVIKEGRI